MACAGHLSEMACFRHLVPVGALNERPRGGFEPSAQTGERTKTIERGQGAIGSDFFDLVTCFWGCFAHLPLNQRLANDCLQTFQFVISVHQGHPNPSNSVTVLSSRFATTISALNHGAKIAIPAGPRPTCSLQWILVSF